MTIDLAGIESALTLLAERYPKARCDVWVQWRDGQISYVTAVEYADTSAFGHGDDPVAAARQLIDANQIVVKRAKRIEELRAELEKLEKVGAIQ